MSIFQLARTNVQTINPYQSARRIGGRGTIWLNANEYPKPTLYKLRSNYLNRYPDCQPNRMINSYAAYAKIPSDQILVCRGADEGIELIIRTFCEPGKDAILFCPPTYGMYRVSAEIFGIKYFAIPTINNWQLDLNKIEAIINHIKVIYICRPNNPTGNMINIFDMRKLLDMTYDKTIIVVDEAYIDFCHTNSLINWLTDYPHLVILRTLSKAFALAGLRCGFTIANYDVIQLLLKVIAPYPISLPVADIAEQALSTEGLYQTKQRVTKINTNRDYLSQKLAECPCVRVVFPSVSNYLLVKFDPAYCVFKSLWDQGIILRDQSQQVGLEDCLRITISTNSECQSLLSTLKTLTLSHPK